MNYCPNCNKNLDEVKGFRNDADCGFCPSCGILLINPNSDERGLKYPNVRWFCDSCNDYLNGQLGFSDWNLKWKCTKCGHENTIDESEIIQKRSLISRIKGFLK